MILTLGCAVSHFTWPEVFVTVREVSDAKDTTCKLFAWKQKLHLEVNVTMAHKLKLNTEQPNYVTMMCIIVSRF